MRRSYPNVCQNLNFEHVEAAVAPLASTFSDLNSRTVPALLVTRTVTCDGHEHLQTAIGKIESTNFSTRQLSHSLLFSHSHTLSHSLTHTFSLSHKLSRSLSPPSHVGTYRRVAANERTGWCVAIHQMAVVSRLVIVRQVSGIGIRECHYGKNKRGQWRKIGK